MKMNKMRKRGWPVVMALALGLVGALALFAALSAPPDNVSHAQNSPLCATPLGAILQECQTDPKSTVALNQPPMVLGQFEAIEMITGETHDVNVASAFTDPDGDALTYRATSDNVFVAGVSTEASVVTIFGLGEGTTTVRVTASDGVLTSPEQTITVSVTPEPNQPPMAEGELRDIEIILGGNPRTVLVSGAFSDPDGDRLTYTAMSGNEMVATVAVSGNWVTVSAGQQIGVSTITVTANDGELDSALLTFSVSVTVPIVERYDITIPGSEATGYEVEVATYLHEYDFEVHARNEFGGPLNEDATVSVLVDAEPPEMLRGSIGLDSPAYDLSHVELQGLLTIRATDEGRRIFRLEVVCEEAGHRVDIQILDDQLRNVGTASILCVAPEPEPPEPDQVSSDCYAVTGHVDQMRDDARAVNEGYRADRPLRTSQEGDDTIEVLTGADDVQLTVTVGTAADGCDPGPVYIRFLDSDRKVFGAGVDKESAAVGADVVGLECHGKLELNLERALIADDAWWYDHYRLVTPENPALAPYLAGKPGTYYQGNFRLFDPCPASGDYFYVEVYENQSKRKVAEEQVVCVPPK